MADSWGELKLDGDKDKETSGTTMADSWGELKRDGDED